MQELKEETTRLSRLKHLLVLFCRMLAVIFLVLAFAQPIIPIGKAATTKANKAVSIYFDNSFSMEGINKEGTLLEVARKKCREIALAYPPSTRFQLLTNDFEAVHQRLISRDELLDELERIKISPVSRMTSEVVARQEEALHQASSSSIYSFIVSDFQTGTSNLNALKPDSLLSLNLVALPVQAGSNIYIDSCWLGSPVVQLNRPVELFVKLHNSGEKDEDNVPVRLMINGSQRAVASVPLEAGKSVTTSINFSVTTAGWQRLKVEISDHPITFDDQYYLTFEVREKLNVISIDDKTGGPYLKALFGQDPFFNFSQTAVSQVDYSQFSSKDLIILNELPTISSGLSSELNKYLEAGGSVVCFPDSTADLNSYATFLQENAFSNPVSGNDKVEKIDLQHPLFSDVFENKKKGQEAIDYPTVQRHFPINSKNGNRLSLMQLQGGDPFLSECTYGKGTLYLFSVPLTPGFSNLARHAMVVPLLYKMALLSMRQPAFAYTLGREVPIELDRTTIGNDQTFHLVNTKLNTDLIPTHRVMAGGVQVNVSGQIKQSGTYDLNTTAGLAAVIAFNYDRKESELNYLNTSAIESEIKTSGANNVQIFKGSTADLTKTLNEISEGIPLWKYCILLTLIFLLAETVLLRFWKTT